MGKVWALEQAPPRRARRAAPAPELLLLTDADILHAPGSLRALVAEAEAGGLDLVSRMARLRCSSRAERLLIPPFVLFFFLLYPMRWANRPGGRVAAAAGGCVLVRAEALARAGGLEAIRGALIDDLALARAVKRSGGTARLALSRGARDQRAALPGRRRRLAHGAPQRVHPAAALVGPPGRGDRRPGADVRGAAGLRRWRAWPGGRPGPGLGASPGRRGRRPGPSWPLVALPAVRAFGLPARGRWRCPWPGRSTR